MLKYCFLIFLFFAIYQADAQQRNTVLPKNTDLVQDTSKKKIPLKIKLKNTAQEIGSLFKDTTALQPSRKAVLRSAIIPGWGQARNHKWWKVPLVYGGFVGLGLVYNFNNKYYKDYLAEAQYRKATPGKDRNTVFLKPQNQGISDQQIYNAKDFYRRNRDLSLYATVGFYALQMVDAYIDARLATFDVSNDLSLRIKPSIYIPSYAASGAYHAPVPMLTLNIRL